MQKELNNEKEERKHMTTRGNKNACGKKECTPNSSSSSRMGWVAKVSFLCLDCQEIMRRKKREMHKYMWSWPQEGPMNKKK